MKKKICFDFKVYSLKVRKYAFDAIVSRSENRIPSGIMDTEEPAWPEQPLVNLPVISYQIMHYNTNTNNAKYFSGEYPT